ncbi:hypothetical protein psal_cds_507 [Pandoravirus salinus]|uniref:Uncharacterized protein n=1 Tax=Pandoravirus salinus TaxID=1349410 RepID=S4VVB6_9VIRU|nr:hypothetical protein psal_cds_507 [Pandoravirus salinus]AGO84313.1 hypothetical protein psal_cds_507 [Pandoravirus salinus]
MNTHRRSSVRGRHRRAPTEAAALLPPPPLSPSYFDLARDVSPPSHAPYGLFAVESPAVWSPWGDDACTGLDMRTWAAPQPPPLHAPWFVSTVPEFVPFVSSIDADHAHRFGDPLRTVHCAPRDAAGPDAGHRAWARRIIADDLDEAAPLPSLMGDLLSWSVSGDDRERECLVDGGVSPPPGLPPPLEPVRALPSSPSRQQQPQRPQKQQQQAQKQRRRAESPPLVRARRNSAQ